MPRKKIDVDKKYISIAQAEDFPLAEDCVKLLKDNNIEAKSEELKRNSYFIQVEEGRFHEAYMIIQNHLTPEGFFDMYRQARQIKDPTQAA